MELETRPPSPPPALIYAPHPLSAQAERVLITAPFLPGESIAAYLDRQGIDLAHRPVVLQLDGATVPRAYWHVVKPKPGRVITVRAAVHGGGSSGDNKTTNTVLTILVLIAAAYTGGAAAGTYGPVAGALVSYAVAYVGMRLVNQIAPLPIKEPEAEPSPTYSLTNSGNSARLYQPMPLVMGTHRVFADLGAKYYTEFLGEHQVLFQVFNFGLSDVVLSEIKIGDTLLTDFAGVTTQESGPSGALTLFPSNVDQLAVGELVEGGAWVTRTSSASTTSLSVELSGIIFALHKKKGTLRNVWVAIEMQYRAVGSGTWLVFHESRGPATEIPPQHDVAGYTVFSTKDRAPLRLGYRLDVAEGQYEVRMRFVSAVPGDWYTYNEDTSDTPGDNPLVTEFVDYNVNKEAELFWDVLRSYQADNADYTGQKRLAVRIQASGQLNGRIDRLNALVSARCLVWNGSTWNLQATSNPAWWFLWFARGKTINGRRAFGGGLPDARIDIEGLKAWGAWCDAKALTVNGIFDRPQSVNDGLAAIARCGRASVSWGSGKLGVIYDAANLPVAAVFGMANIRRGTFGVEYLTEDLADEIEIEFINPALGWLPDVVRKAVPGALTSGERTARVQFFGCTSQDMAGREANLMAAAQKYRRRRASWETDIEGLVVNRGDVVILSHDLTQWAYSGRLVAGTTTQLTLDRKVPFTPATSHYVGVRAPDGTYTIHDVIYSAGEHDVIDLNGGTPLASSPNADPDHPPCDWLWFFEPEATPGRKMKILHVQPLSEHHVRLTAIDEDEAYYLEEVTSYTYVPPSTFGVNLPTITRLSVTDTLVPTGNGYAVIVKIAWDVSGEYGGAFVRIGREDEPLRDAARVLGRRFEFQAPLFGAWQIEVTAFNLLGQYGANSTLATLYTPLGKDREPADVTGFVVTQNGPAVVLKWDRLPDVDLVGYFVRYGPVGSSWDDATPLTEADQGTTMTTSAVPPGTFDFFIKARDQSTPPKWSVNAAVATLTVENLFDLVVQREQAPDWSGTVSNFVRHWTGVLAPESQSLANAQDDQTLFDNFVLNPYITCTYETPEIDLGFDSDVRVWADLVSALGPGEVNGVASPKLQIDYKLAAGAYGGWQDWTIGQIRARYVKLRLVLDTSVGRAKITGFLATLDAIEFAQRGQNVTIGASGTAINFPEPFHLTPSVRVWVSDGAVRIATFTGASATGFTAHVYNTSGTEVGGVVSWEAVGI